MLREQLKGSLLERLFLGDAVFPKVHDYRAMPSRERKSLFFDNAQLNVFAYEVQDRAFDVAAHEDNPQFHPAAQSSFLSHLNTYSEYFKNLRCTTRWNLFAWFEFVTLYWLNEATFYHKPRQQSRLSSFFSGINIALAYVFNAAAKTINLVGTPILAVIAGVFLETLAAMANQKGVAIGLFIMGVLSAIAVCVGLYYAYAYCRSGKEASKKSLEEMFEFKKASSSLFFGLITPLIRATQHFKDFYREHPIAASASFVLGLSVVLMTTILPSVGVTPVMGFEIRGMILHQIAKTLTMPGTDPVSMKILSKAVVGALSFGVMDIFIRATKEICSGFKLCEEPEDPLAPIQQNVTSLQKRASVSEDSTTRLIQNELSSTFPNLGSGPSARDTKRLSL